MDDKYIRRCQKRLKEWGAPLSDWYCLYVVDITENEEDYATCELCDCSKVRFIHVMSHDKYFENIDVGCICAGIMEGDILVAEERERKFRNRANRKKNFIKKEWTPNQGGGYRMKYKGEWIFIYPSRYDSGTFGVVVKKETVWRYKKKAIRDLLSAAHLAFDLIDPPEKIIE